MKVKDTALSYKTTKRKYTYQDYLELPDDGKRYEIINGELVMVAAPFTIHMRISKKIYNLLLSYSEDETKGEIFYAPIDVVLGDTNVFQPDLLYIKKENSYIITEKNIYGAPDLIVEILSPSTAYYDLFDKKEIYAQFGVQEYWIVDPMKQSVEIYLNRENIFELRQRLDKEGEAKSDVLKGFQVDVKEIFKFE
jgi:Uma2 family endonuclease